ncbi:hypothetical protein HBZC1_10120 [Helicobacter bizzozeronii CIII-1]|uniref:Uncharacterized protein n=1 Tax=Helicobacter bizzozeronii (strain CIII-1) TaxID=1002804 RepID=F8KT51_HELBC|nr:hypothetical protein HBZC1_10120 [Helicobacter bizzozeronii CIII-1]CCF80050.1 hypothetical protein HBZS_104980 [Helicobacter bizzozeronii CCUG 35545]
MPLERFCQSLYVGFACCRAFKNNKIKPLCGPYSLLKTS